MQEQVGQYKKIEYGNVDVSLGDGASNIESLLDKNEAGTWENYNTGPNRNLKISSGVMPLDLTAIASRKSSFIGGGRGSSYTIDRAQS